MECGAAHSQPLPCVCVCVHIFVCNGCIRAAVSYYYTFRWCTCAALSEFEALCVLTATCVYALEYVCTWLSWKRLCNNSNNNANVLNNGKNSKSRTGRVFTFYPCTIDGWCCCCVFSLNIMLLLLFWLMLFLSSVLRHLHTRFKIIFLNVKSMRYSCQFISNPGEWKFSHQYFANKINTNRKQFIDKVTTLPTFSKNNSCYFTCKQIHSKKFIAKIYSYRRRF